MNRSDPCQNPACHRDRRDAHGRPDVDRPCIDCTHCTGFVEAAPKMPVIDQPCKWCTRYFEHFDFCPTQNIECRCSTLLGYHTFGNNPRCMYVGDNQLAKPNPYRGWVPNDITGMVIDVCHWPNPSDVQVVMTNKDCRHYLRPWDYVHES